MMWWKRLLEHRVAAGLTICAKSFAHRGLADADDLGGKDRRVGGARLADRIVDLVDTGNTLRANGLAPLEHICDISARLIVNKAAMKTKHARVTALIAALSEAVAKAAARRPR